MCEPSICFTPVNTAFSASSAPLRETANEVFDNYFAGLTVCLNFIILPFSSVWLDVSSRAGETWNFVMACLRCQDLVVGYGAHPVSSALSFEVEQGDYLCIVGENGAGKSTLVQTLLGLLPAISGSIEFGEGFEPSHIGYLPQQTALQKDFPAIVNEVVLSGFQNRIGWRPFYSRREKLAARKCMIRLGIESLSRKCYRQLSGGQQQRTLLCRALCAGDRMLLLDEPTASLDPQATESLYELIRRLNREGMTIVMVTHDLFGASTEAKHFLRLGKTPVFGTADQLLRGGE